MAKMPDMIVKVDGELTEETADLLKTLISEIKALREQPKSEVHNHYHYTTCNHGYNWASPYKYPQVTYVSATNEVTGQGFPPCTVA